MSPVDDWMDIGVGHSSFGISPPGCCLSERRKESSRIQRETISERWKVHWLQHRREICNDRSHKSSLT